MSIALRFTSKSEIGNPMAWLEEYGADDLVLVASWLHVAFFPTLSLPGRQRLGG